MGFSDIFPVFVLISVFFSSNQFTKKRSSRILETMYQVSKIVSMNILIMTSWIVKRTISMDVIVMANVDVNRPEFIPYPAYNMYPTQLVQQAQINQTETTDDAAVIQHSTGRIPAYSRLPIPGAMIQQTPPQQEQRQQSSDSWWMQPLIDLFGTTRNGAESTTKTPPTPQLSSAIIFRRPGMYFMKVLNSNNIPTFPDWV